MRRVAPTASALLLLTACQQAPDGPSTDAARAAPAIEPALTQLRSSDCGAFGNPTVVSYHSRPDTRTQHSVHLLNPDAEAARAAGCDHVMPVASVVTLRYRIAGG